MRAAIHACYNVSRTELLVKLVSHRRFLIFTIDMILSSNLVTFNQSHRFSFFVHGFLLIVMLIHVNKEYRQAKTMTSFMYNYIRANDCNRYILK